MDANKRLGFEVAVEGSNCVGRIGNAVPNASWQELSAPLAPATARNGWHHVVLTYDHAAKKATLYVDGAAAATQAGTAYSANLRRDTRIGAGRTESATAGDFFHGRLDEVALYSVALNGGPTDQVATHFAAAGP